MDKEAIAKRYATAIYDIAESSGKIGEIREALNILAENYREDEDFKLFLLDPSIKYDKKVEYLHKSFDFVIKTPPAAVQLLEAAKIKGGSGEPNRKKVANITWDQVRAIAEDKLPDLSAFTIEKAMSIVAGTARSMGITITGDKPF